MCVRAWGTAVTLRARPKFLPGLSSAVGIDLVPGQDLAHPSNLYPRSAVAAKGSLNVGGSVTNWVTTVSGWMSSCDCFQVHCYPPTAELQIRCMGTGSVTRDM